MKLNRVGGRFHSDLYENQACNRGIPFDGVLLALKFDEFPSDC